jgi:dTDP-4-dehydrorhamnose reductase
MRSKILVVGGDSSIAGGLLKELTRRGDIVFQTSRREDNRKALFLDLLNVDAFLQEASAPEVDTVIICAGVTKFSDCRDGNSQARKINVDAPARIAEFYSAKGAKVILLSTSAVFNGSVPFEKAETIPNSSNEYGKLKAEAEKEVLAAGKNTVVIRLSKVLAPGNPLFSGWAKNLQNGKKIKVFTDQFIAPITLSWATRSIIAVIDDKETGIYQFSANRDISYYQAALHLAQYHSVDMALVESEKASEKGIPENETSAFSSLDSSRLENLLSANAPDPLHELDIFYSDFHSAEK